MFDYVEVHADLADLKVCYPARHTDERGFLSELWRTDEDLFPTKPSAVIEVKSSKHFHPAFRVTTDERLRRPGPKPAMCYISSTKPGVMRGPHEHKAQTDRFAFFDGNIIFYAWNCIAETPYKADGSPKYTYNYREIRTGRNNPTVVEVPVGIIHAYKNIGPGPALVINLPNKLYAGEGKEEEIDEIRWEEVEGWFEENTPQPKHPKAENAEVAHAIRLLRRKGYEIHKK